MAAVCSIGSLWFLISSVLLTTRTEISTCKSNEKLFHLLGSLWHTWIFLPLSKLSRVWSWVLEYLAIYVDLLQVDLTSFLASGASFLGREAAKRATKSREVYTWRCILISRLLTVTFPIAGTGHLSWFLFFIRCSGVELLTVVSSKFDLLHNLFMSGSMLTAFF